MKLSELKNNQKAIIVKVRGRGAFRKRILEMGFVKGQEVKVIKYAPLKDPVEYLIMGYMVSLRRSEAALIEVISEKEAEKKIPIEYNGTVGNNLFKKSARQRSKIINIALVGNPNCGKTTLFNKATGSTEHVGNYSGVTVDAKKSKTKHKGYKFNVTDLPGTYSLTAYTPEELYVRKHILDEVPDIVVNVIDASNLERNLYLTSRLIDMDIKVVIALNMYDELKKQGDKFNYIELGRMLGIPIIPTVAAIGVGVDNLFDKIIDVYEDKDETVRHIHINYGKAFEKAITELQTKIRINENTELISKVAPRFIALNLLEKDIKTSEVVKNLKNSDTILKTSKTYIQKIESNLKEDTETLITDARYGFIHGALKETFKPGSKKKHEHTKIIDSFLTHRLFGIPIFILFMWLMFQGTFVLGEYPMNWLSSGVAFISEIVQQYVPQGMLKDLIIGGVINGVGGVIVFLPNILLLFFFISIMEDTGYMSRAAFITDRVMHKIGLHGKSFIPLIMGFGCNVPAIMATRTLESRNDRLLTMLINPFMSCSARLPVYLIVIGAVFPSNAGTVLFLIYSTGILLSIIVAKFFKKVIFKSKDAPFVMELPPYRKPVLKVSLKHMWNKGSQYLQKMGGIILIASIIIWALGYFPTQTKNTESFNTKIEQLSKQNKQIMAENGNTPDYVIIDKIQKIKIEKEADRQKYSYIGKIGRFIEPVIKPLGFDWKIGVSLVSGIAAKEIVVSTMGVLYSANSEDENLGEVLKNKIRTHVYDSGSKKGKLVFTPLTAVSFLIFILVYFPCIAVIIAIKKESGSWKWALFTAGYTTALAWVLSFSVYQIGNLF